MDATITELIGRRRRQVLVHSALYYRMNENIISDFTYDQWSKELAQLQRDYPNEAQAAPLAEEFAEFDGSSGFDLPISNPDVINRATHLVNYYKKRRKGDG